MSNDKKIFTENIVELSPEEELKWREIHQMGSDSYKERCGHCQKPVYQIIKAPKETDIELWTWTTQCWKCQKNTPVVWPNRGSCDFTWESLSPQTFKNLPDAMQKKFTFFKIIEKRTMGVVEHGNSCINCGAYQGDWFVIEDLLEISYEPESVEKHKVSIQLTDDEQVYFAHPKKVMKMHSPRKGSYSNLCDSCYTLYKKKLI